MIEGLKPYADYKVSGQEWLGSIPAHWDVRRTKLLLREVDSRSSSGKEQLLRVSQYTGVTQRKAADGSDAPDTRAASLVGYKRVAANDLVINIMLAWNGSLGASRYDGIASPAYCVYRFRKGALPWYYHELFRLPLYKGRIKTASTGVVESRLRLYSDDLGRIEALLPPPEEQAAIVRFLDHANRKIDGFIRAKRKLIGLLNEQKQAIIHRAVTRGLDPDVPLKPSGIPWLGDIPAHWAVWRISRFAKVGNGSTPSRSNSGFWSGGSYPWLNSSHVNRGFIDSADQFVTSLALRQCHLPKVAAGSVLMAITGQGKTRGTSAVLGFEATINQHIAYITPRVSVVSANYLHLSLVAAYSTLRSISDDSGSTKGALTCEDLKRFKLAVPPIDEQGWLVEAIATETKAVSTAITRTEREIALMQEYRTRLTADIVTGKLDVREAAAKLPDLPSEPRVDEALEDTDILDETEPEES
jgi:type I restriction enzyme, S subunit